METMEASSSRTTDPRGSRNGGRARRLPGRWPRNCAVFHASTRAAAARMLTAVWLGPRPNTGIPASRHICATYARVCVLPAPAGASIGTQPAR